MMELINFYTAYHSSSILVLLLINVLYVISSTTVSVEEDKSCGFRDGERYILCKYHIEDFKTKGLAIIHDIITEEEILTIEGTYNEYMANGSPEIQGKDFCDMSKPFDTPREEYSVINAMLPVSN
jgi:hypothetical protein